MHTPADTLDQELTAAQRLLEVLEQEQACLVNANADAMNDLTAEKANLVAAMNDLARRRHRTLAVAGFAADESGMEGWLQGSVPSSAASAWKRLLDIAQKARELNRTNGLLIAQHLSRTQGALNILQGSRNGGSLYGPNGQSTGPFGSRGLVVG